MPKINAENDKRKKAINNQIIKQKYYAFEKHSNKKIFHI